MKLDLLVLAAHPDDAELGAGGTIASHVAQGKRVGVIDFTRGELGTRGTPEDRDQEAANSASILGLSLRENLGFADGFFQNNREHQLALIQLIRRYQPEIVLANALSDRHIDHGRAALLARDACFLSGLRKVETKERDGSLQNAWRPKLLLHYIQDYYLEPDLVVDVSKFWEKKIKAVRAFKTQFFDPKSQEPQTPISTPEFMNFLEGRAQEMGRKIGVKYGEGFQMATPPKVNNLFNLL